MVLALLTVTLAAGHVGAAVLARHRAQSSADLAALAAAATLPAGPAAACGRARDLAATMGSAVIDCAVTGLDVTVQVSVGVRLGGREARAVARAGPV